MSKKNSVLTTCSLSTYFPGNYNYEIIRENLINSLEKVSKIYDFVYVTGETGSGKTVLIKQFAEKNKNISIFIPQTNSIAASLEIILSSLIKQIRLLLNKDITKALPESLIQLKLQYHRELNDLVIHAATKETVYFIVDGLDHVSENSESTIEVIIRELRPSGKIKIPTIITTSGINPKVNILLENIPYEKREFQMSGFTTGEVNEIFKDVGIELNTIREIGKVFSGNPSNISEFRKIIDKKRDDIEDLIKVIPDDIFEYIWKRENTSSDCFIEILSIVIFSFKNLSLKNLSEILEIDKSIIVNYIEKSNLIEIKDEKCIISNETFLKKIKEKLEYKKKYIYELLAKYTKKSNKKNDLWLLSLYYRESESYSELFSLLDNFEYIQSVINTSSMSSLKHLVDTGFRVSENIDSLENRYKFSLESSLLRSTEISDESSDVEALMLLNQEEKAILLARSSKVIENKVHLLSIIAKNQKLNRGMVDEAITSEINSIFDMYNIEYLGNKGIAIASELISIDADLAIKLLEKTFSVENDDNAIDKIMLSLSLDTFHKIDEKNRVNLFKDISSKMKNPELKDIFSTMFRFNESISAANLLKEVKKIKALGPRINFLANWCYDNDASEEKVEILDFAFNELSTSSEYKSNIDIYYKLSKQLKLASQEESKTIIKMFDKRQCLLDPSGPTVLYVKTILNIIMSLDKYEKHEAMDRIEKLYIYIEDMDDVSIKIECKANLLKSIDQCNNREYYESNLGIISEIENELNNHSLYIIDNYAYQQNIFEKTLEVLAPIRLEFCLNTVDKVNIVTNKEMLYKSIIRGLISDSEYFSGINNNFEENILSIIQIIKKIEHDSEIYDASIFKLIESLHDANDDITLSLYHQLISLIETIRDIRLLIVCYTFMINILNRNQNEKFYSELFKKIKNSWKEIDIVPNKVALGYELVTILVKKDKESAEKIFNLIQEEKKDFEQFSTDELWAFILSIKLLIHSMSKIEYSDNSEIQRHIDNIKELINYIDSNGEKAILYSELFLTISPKTSSQVSKSITSLITECIDNINAIDGRYKTYVLRKCAPVLYKEHRTYFDSNIKIASKNERDDIYTDLCFYFIANKTVDKPFEYSSKSKYECTYEDILEYIRLCEMVYDDSIKYGLVKTLLSMIKNDKGPTLNLERKNDLKIKIKNVIEHSFSTGLYINHEGYKILSEYAYWITFESFKEDKIDDYLERINRIPNLSDQIFCRTFIAASIIPKSHSKRDRILRDTEELIEKMEVISEQIYRYEGLADEISSKNSSLEKKYIEKALNLIENYEDSSAEKRLVDLAYQIDPDFANSIVSGYKGKDNISEKRLKEMDRKLKTLELKTRIKQDKGKEDFTELNYDEAIKVAETCWKSYGSILAKNINPKKPENLKNYLGISAKLPIEKAYLIFSWFIENSNKKSNNTLKLQLFEANYLACQFALVNNQYIGKINDDIENYYDNNKTSVQIQEGERQYGIEFIFEKLNQGEINELIIVDPYFDLVDLNFINELNSLIDNDDIIFNILTGPRKNSRQLDDIKNEQEFSHYWKKNVSSEEPPDLQIVIVKNVKNGDCPFHDRYIIADEYAVQIGGSINGLGKAKDISINLIDDSTRNERSTYFRYFIDNKIIQLKRKKIEVNINAFSL